MKNFKLSNLEVAREIPALIARGNGFLTCGLCNQGGMAADRQRRDAEASKSGVEALVRGAARRGSLEEWRGSPGEGCRETRRAR